MHSALDTGDMHNCVNYACESRTRKKKINTKQREITPKYDLGNLTLIELATSINYQLF